MARGRAFRTDDNWILILQGQFAHVIWSCCRKHKCPWSVRYLLFLLIHTVNYNSRQRSWDLILTSMLCLQVSTTMNPRYHATAKYVDGNWTKGKANSQYFSVFHKYNRSLKPSAIWKTTDAGCCMCTATKQLNSSRNVTQKQSANAVCRIGQDLPNFSLVIGKRIWFTSRCKRYTLNVFWPPQFSEFWKNATSLPPSFRITGSSGARQTNNKNTYKYHGQNKIPQANEIYVSNNRTELHRE